MPFILVLALLGFSLTTFWGCEEINPNAVSPEDSTAAVAAVEQAHTALESLMGTMLNADPDSAQQMLDMLDFSAAYELYVNAHELDPRNNEANFGLGFTGFLMVSQDPALQDMVLRWEHYFNLHEPFVVDDGGTLGKSGFGLPLNTQAMVLPLAHIIETPLALSKMSIDDVPQFSEFQALVEATILPVVATSITALTDIDLDSNFVFIVSGAMQGDAEATPIELDLTEVYALESGMEALKSVLLTVTAYNFDFVSFDSVGIVTELSQGSDFATLKSGGSAALSGAHTAALLAADKAVSALDFLESETDNQDDDLIHFNAEDDPGQIRATIEDFQASLQAPNRVHYTYWEDMYDDDGNWTGEQQIEDSLMVDIAQFFLNPVTDFKAMLPPYTMGTQRIYSYEYNHLMEHIHAEEDSVNISGLDNAYLSVTFDYALQDSMPQVSALVNLGYFQYDLLNTPESDLPAAVWDLYAQFQELIVQYSDQLYHYPSISFFWSGNVSTGTSLVIDGDIAIDYEVQTAVHVAPLVTWNASSYDEWLLAWPDPTMQGIFPEMTAAELANFLGIDEYNWNDFSI